MKSLLFQLLLGSVGLAVAADPVAVTVTDISQGGLMRAAVAINDSGEVVGYGDLGGASRALLLRSGELIDLGAISGLIDSRAASINERGQIAGHGTKVGGTERHALVWSAEGELLDLHPPSPGLSWAPAINDRGDVVLNFVKEGTAGPSVALWKEASLFPLGPGIGQAINRQGLVVGSSLWKHGKEVPLVDLGDERLAMAVNDAGDVVGYDIFRTWGDGFLLRFPRDERTPLMPLPGDTIAVPFGIDGRGRVVGISMFCEFECWVPRTRAVYWEEGIAIPLPALLPYWSCVARGINEVGEVVGFCGEWCTREDCLTSRAVLWRFE
jgi:uncharacterized membrane protein